MLAAGGIENPRLLLASGGIGNGHDLVGRYFMDHPRLRLRHLLIGEDPGSRAALRRAALRRWVGGDPARPARRGVFADLGGAGP